MRGGLDDALDKLARRDELRRRAAAEATGTPPAVQELVEAIAAVVGRNSHLEVTVGVEGAGEPTLLHFFVEEGQVQVTADTTVASRISEPGPKHADFEVVVEEPVEVVEEPPAPPVFVPPPPARDEAGEATRRISYDDRDRYDPGTGYESFESFTEPDPAPYATRYERTSAFPASDAAAPDNPYLSPFAATPPPEVPPQTTRRIRPEQHRAPEPRRAPEQPANGHSRRAADDPGRADDQRRAESSNGNGWIRAEHHRAPEEQSASERAARGPLGEQRGMPAPLPEPIPLKVDSKETEQAAKRLAALLRDNPSLLRPGPTD